MELNKLIKVLTQYECRGQLNRDISGIAYDSRKVTPGMMFVALKGQNVDGHNFIEDAIERGAVAIICEHDVNLPARITKIQVPDSRLALALVSAEFYGNPSKKLRLIGITGTNGKTTVAFMVKAILETAGIKTGLIGTVRYEIGERVIPAWRTTPESLDLQYMLNQMVKTGCSSCVMEVSSHALEQRRVEGIDFNAVVFTNLTQDHLDYHQTMENYYSAKKKLFLSEYHPSKKPVAIINIDDSYGNRLAGESDLAVKCTYGLQESAMVNAKILEMTRSGARFIVHSPNGSFECNLPLIGKHNIYNAIAAVGVGTGLNIPVKSIQSALNNIQPVPGRLEVVDLGQPFTVVVDYAHTDDALRNVLSALRELTQGRLLLAFGCGGSRDTSKRAKMGAVAAKYADYTIITTDNPRKESPHKIAAQIVEGYVANRTDGFSVELDRKRAIQMIIDMAEPGDTVIIAGKGHETYQEFEDTIIPFDDRVYAKEALQALGYGNGVKNKNKSLLKVL